MRLLGARRGCTIDICPDEGRMRFAPTRTDPVYMITFQTVLTRTAMTVAGVAHDAGKT